LWPLVMAVCTVILTLLAMIGGISGLVKNIACGARVVFRCKARVSNQEAVMQVKIDDLEQQLADATSEVVALKLVESKLVSDIAALNHSAATTNTTLPAEIFVSGGSGTKYHTSNNCQGLRAAIQISSKALCLHCSRQSQG
jgi:low affinity Fe/Cu permease